LTDGGGSGTKFFKIIDFILKWNHGLGKVSILESKFHLTGTFEITNPVYATGSGVLTASLKKFDKAPIP